MTSIASTNTSMSGVLASLVDSASGSAPSAANTSAHRASLTTSGSGDPVDIVDLSDRAKQILARANVEQAAADKLSGFLQSLKDPTGKSATSPDSAHGQGSLFNKLSGRSDSAADTTTWTAGSKFGDASISDADFNSEIEGSLRAALADFPPEKRAALEAAISTGP